MAQFITLDLCIYLGLLFCVVGMPWMILTLGLRSALNSIELLDEEAPPRHAALIARYRNSL